MKLLVADSGELMGASLDISIIRENGIFPGIIHIPTISLALGSCPLFLHCALKY